MRKPHFLAVYMLFLPLLLPAGYARANEIDSLRTNKDVIEFLTRRVNKKFRDYPVLDTVSTDEGAGQRAAEAAWEKKSQGGESAGYTRNSFFKIDIDNNHLRDLVIYGNRSLLVILDAGRGNYKVRYLERNENPYALIKLIAIDTVRAPVKIVIERAVESEPETDTLVYLFDNFIEYNPAPDTSFTLQRIRLISNQCNGTCPVFDMVVVPDRTVLFNAIQFNAAQGQFSGIVPRQDFEEMVALLRYLKPANLRDRYAVARTDDQTLTTEIVYNGRAKLIRDYGEEGTFGLRRLYAQFFAWQKSIDWMRED